MPTNTNYAEYQFYFNVFQFFFTCLIGIIAWWRTRERDDTTKLNALSESMQLLLEKAKTDRDASCEKHKSDTTRIDKECQIIQIALARLPSDDKIIALHKRLDVLVQTFATFQGEIKGELKGMSHTLDLLQEHHLREKD